MAAMVPEYFEVYVSRDDFKFNAAHFMAYPGFRERLHGHNYRVSVRVEGGLHPDGYVIDFGDIKRATRALCQEMNERVLIPADSDCLSIAHEDGQIEVICEDGARFSFPDDDCIVLPIAHSSAEELAAYLCRRLADALPALQSRRLAVLEVAVAEAPGQEARYRLDL